MGAQRFIVGAIVLFGCGGGGGSGDSPDAATEGDDASIDAPMMVACGFTEAADATNNTTAGAEVTMLSVGATATAICGRIDNGHYNPTLQVVDSDAYKVTVAADSDLLVHVTGALGDVARVVLQVGTTAGSPLNLGVYEGDHGTVSVRLPAGEYVVAVSAFNPADATATADYRIVLAGDAPATRCAKVTAAADYTESNDGAGSLGNDVISVDEAASPTTRLTASPADAPEPSNLTVAAGTQYRITGTSGLSDPPDDYEDRDTYAFTTGATTNQLSVRLNWAATTIDFDYRVFPADTVVSVTGALATSLVEDEFQTFAVKPNTAYWLWVGAYDGATGQPAVYDATICAESFTP